MKSLANTDVFGTQYSTIYDLNTLKVRIYLFHDYTQFIVLDLKTELDKGNHNLMIADLFPKQSIGYQHYQKYNDVENPQLFLEELVNNSEKVSEKELEEMDFNSIINRIGYEWLNDMDNAKAAIKIFEFGTSIMPNDADLFDSLGEVYFQNENYQLSKLNFEKSLVLNPDNEKAEAFIAKINLRRDN